MPQSAAAAEDMGRQATQGTVGQRRVHDLPGAFADSACRHDRGPAKQSGRARGSVKENPRTPARVETPGISKHTCRLGLCACGRRSKVFIDVPPAPPATAHASGGRCQGSSAGSTMRPAAPSKPPQSAEHSFPQCSFGVPFTTGSCRYRRRSRTTPGRRTLLRRRREKPPGTACWKRSQAGDHTLLAATA